MIQQITGKSGLLALIVRAGHDASGIEFFTPNEFSQQLAYMHHPVGRSIDPHCHNPMPRQVLLTQEVLFIRKGRMRMDLFESDQTYVGSEEVGAGDVVLLASGGHGFHVLEDLEMFEVKQGPYVGPEEKTRFLSSAPEIVALTKAD